MSQYHKDWQYEDTFLTQDMHGVMDLDATLNSHPIIQVLVTNNILELFLSLDHANKRVKYHYFVLARGSSRPDY